jgi:hypothetical protein
LKTISPPNQPEMAIRMTPNTESASGIVWLRPDQGGTAGCAEVKTCRKYQKRYDIQTRVPIGDLYNCPIR